MFDGRLATAIGGELGSSIQIRLPSEPYAFTVRLVPTIGLQKQRLQINAALDHRLNNYCFVSFCSHHFLMEHKRRRRRSLRIIRNRRGKICCAADAGAGGGGEENGPLKDSLETEEGE